MILNQTARRIAVIALLTLIVPTAPALAQREECTSAVLGPAATVSGAPVLWKNRDTNTLSNRVVFVDERPYSYLCLRDRNFLFHTSAKG